MMKQLTNLLAFLLICLFAGAQSADEIVENYFENTGGAEAWGKLEAVQFNASVNSPQVGEIPLTIYNDKEGCTLVKMTFQGNEMTQVAFDGEVAWSWNMQGQMAEKMEAEDLENMKRAIKEFPDPFLNYKENGFSIEKLENETIEGTECFKIKITKENMLIEGEEVENVTYYYFDTENFVPILLENEIKQGQAKGMIQQIFYSDYQEVEGIYFPFSITQGVKGYPGQTMTIKSIDINQKVDKAVLAFPEG